jgi:type VI secretion system protein ImpH
MGREADALTLFAALSEEPFRHDFYETMRRIECFFADKPRWGQALRPVDEAVRLGQEPELTFAPAPLASFTAPDSGPPRLQVRLYGLFGPNGPLPLHITEYARERLRHAADPTFCRFLDMLQHRFIALFYRAWAQAQPHVNRDRPGEDKFRAYVGAFVGVAPAAFRDRDAAPDLAKLFHAGVLVRQARNAEGLAAIVEHFFRIPARVREFVGHWMELAVQERTYLGQEGSATLGVAAVAGATVWDRQHKFRLELGPLTLAEYEAFLPGGDLLDPLVAWVRTYLCFELAWDVRLVLRENEVPFMALGRAGRLGWTSWLGRRQAGTDAGDLCLDAEVFVTRAGVRAA